VIASLLYASCHFGIECTYHEIIVIPGDFVDQLSQNNIYFSLMSRMHSRFWTFLAAGNVFLFLMTACTNYFSKDNIVHFDASLFYRVIPDWSDSIKQWRKFYQADATPEQHQQFLPVGLAMFKCSSFSSLPLCQCLEEVHDIGMNQCKEAALQKLNQCFMFVRNNIRIEEQKASLNLYALLDTLNLWGLLGGCVIWIRMYVCKEDESMPYGVQFLLGIFGAIIHCSVLEPNLSSFLVYLALVIVMCSLSYYHRTDKMWWMSIYMIQYMFTVPNFVLLTNVATQKRDMLYMISSTMMAVVYGLSALGRSLFDEYEKDSDEYAGSKNIIRVIMIFIILLLCLVSYDSSGTYLLRSASATPFSNAFSAVLAVYLLLGVLCPNNLKRVCFMDWSLRFVVSMFMLKELNLS